MPFEVEQKFSFSDEAEFQDFSSRVVSQLITHYNGVDRGIVEETDSYYNHPSRNFVETDEALRIRFRTINGQHQARITYKGPKLDKITKTRKELEIPLCSPTNDDCSPLVEKWEQILQALGFTRVGQVHKIRRKIHFVWNDQKVELSLDYLPAISGYFAEIELIAPTESDLDSCRSQLLQITNSLKLVTIVKKSYLDLVINP